MLVLSRKRETEIYIGSDITIKVLEIHKRQVTLGIKAPSGFSVRRGEPLPITHHGDPAVGKGFIRSCFKTGDRA